MVDHLEAGLARLLEEDVLWLEVSMDDPGPGQGRQGQQDAVAEVPHQGGVETLEPVLLDQLVQVERHELEDDAGVVPEHEAVLHVDNVGAALRVLHQKML